MGPGMDIFSALIMVRVTPFLNSMHDASWPHIANGMPGNGLLFSFLLLTPSLSHSLLFACRVLGHSEAEVEWGKQI